MLNSRKSKVLFLQNAVSNVPSGGEIRFYNILCNIKSKVDYSIIGFFSKNKMNKDFNIDYGIKRRYSFYDKFGFLSFFFRLFDALFNVLRKKVSIVYSTSDFFPDTIPAFFYKLFHPKTRWIQCVFHIYTHWSKRPGNKVINFFGYYLQKLSLFLIKRKADRIILINHLVKKDLIKLGFDKKKLKVIDCGVDIEYFDKIKKTKSKYDVIFLARLNSSKGIFDLIPLWRLVVKQIPNASLGVIGGGDESIKLELKDLIKKNKLRKNIFILGYLNDKKAYSLLKSGEAFLFPSHEEGWGIVIAEAMACKLPVISWDLPVYKELFENKIIKVKEGDIRLLSKKVIDLLKNKNKRLTLGKKGYKFVKKYSWKRVSREELSTIIG